MPGLSTPAKELPSYSPGSESGDRADVCLLLEGTWPYVRGGVSTWVHQILTSLPEVRFSVVFVGAEKRSAGNPKYESPPNLVSFSEMFLFDPSPSGGESFRLPLTKTGRHQWKEAHQALGRYLLPAEILDDSDRDQRLSDAFLAAAKLAEMVSFDRFWAHPDTWDLLQRCYHRHFGQTSFVDFFWNVRFLLEPVWKLLRLEEHLPEARLYHSVSTGYAGLLGALVARRRPDSRFLLSEHGIYVRERIAEILHAEWTGPRAIIPAASGEIPALRKLWIDFFVEIGRFSYHSAARIVGLFQRNAAAQIEFGAAPERMLVIPNGVNLERFAPIREARQQKRLSDPHRQTVGFYGRVVSIKDVKTLIRAARLTIDLVPGARFLIVGPTDEDPAYFAECQELTKQLGLEDRVTFTGAAPPEEALPEFDVMVLSSVSEGLPFAVLEGYAAGMPVVSTDVGSCSELILGREDEDPGLGPAGAIVPIADAGALARALSNLLQSRERQDQCGAAGLARTERIYTEEGVIRQYRDLYHALTSEKPAGAA